MKGQSLGVGILAVALMATVASSRADDGRPATTGTAAETAARIDKNGIGLTAEQIKMISQSTAGQKEQELPGNMPAAIGAPVPDSLSLMEMPVEVKDQVGVLRDFKFARLRGDTILLVDPTSRLIVDVIPNSPN